MNFPGGSSKLPIPDVIFEIDKPLLILGHTLIGLAIIIGKANKVSGKVAHPVFVEDVNANAKGFEYLYRCTVTGV